MKLPPEAMKIHVIPSTFDCLNLGDAAMLQTELSQGLCPSSEPVPRGNGARRGATARLRVALSRVMRRSVSAREPSGLGNGTGLVIASGASLSDAQVSRSVDRPGERVSRSVSAEARTSAPAGEARILVILPRGEAIRNFVYTGTLEELAEEIDVRVLSVIPSEDFRQSIQDRHGDLLELRERPDPWAVRITREILELAHGRFLWSAAARERWRLRDREANAPVAWVKRRLKKLAALSFASPVGLALLSRLECSLSHGAAPTRFYRELFGDLQPTLLFNGSQSHGWMAIDAVHAARSLGIPTATFLFSWDNLTSQGRIMPLYDYYLVWNGSIRDQLLRMYPSVTSDRVFVTGTPQFDFHFRPEFHWTREEFCARVGADASRPIVLYTTGMANHMPGEPQIVEGIATMLREMREFGPPQLLVRVYAKDRTGRFEELKRRDPTILFPEVPWEPAHLTPLPEDGPLLTNMLLHAAVGINVASTVSLELCMFDKPVVNVGYNPPGLDVASVDYRRYYEFDHYRPVVESGAVSVAGSEPEMRRLIGEALAEPAARSAQRRLWIRAMMGEALDGRSAERVAAALLTIARSEGKTWGRAEA